jgi:hypothetical protein
MGGFTKFQLKDTSEENIAKHNAKLREFGVAKKYRFYSLEDVRIEYEYFKLEDGNWPEEFFPKDKIKSFKDFQKYWNPKALGEVFVAPIGALIFDCYFGRTSKNAMRGIGKYLAVNHRDIELATGSYDTFFERGMTRLERQIMKESSIKFNY